jgi:hypothetical protein
VPLIRFAPTASAHIFHVMPSLDTEALLGSVNVMKDMRVPLFTQMACSMGARLAT